jgi:tetratricopeptide (TPR) repeat protein
MASYEKWFGAGPELAVLRVLGLFNRPADGPAVAVLRAAPAIPDLTDALFHTEQQKGLRAVFSRRKPKPLSDQDWNRAVAKLRRARLLVEKDPTQPDTLDGHPLVREHFGQQLRQEHPEAWRKGNNRLYEHLKGTAEEYPDTIEEMARLFAAVAHGCQAGRHQEALDEVYWRRIQRKREAFSVKKLGAFGADLAALSGFFDPPWHQPVAGLSEEAKAVVLNWAGFRLWALGRLVEAAQPMQTALEAHTAQKNWKESALDAGNISELYLTSGDLAQALDFAQHSIDLAERSGNLFRRIVTRTQLANALQQAGRRLEAKAVFRAAEAMQKEDQPEPPFLYSLRGYVYCDLLLGQGKYQEVQSRASQMLEWAKQIAGGVSLLDIALIHLSLGRAHLLQAQRKGTGDCAQAVAHLERAVDGLRQAGQQDHLSRGLLARAGLRRTTGSLDRARADLEEALSIATRGGMRLHEADCHLEYAWLHLVCGEQEKARESLARAKGMVEEMGYRRRDGEVAELEGEFWKS